MDTRLFRIISYSIWSIAIALLVFFALHKKTNWIDNTNADYYHVGKTIIKNPVIVLMPNHRAEHLTRYEEIGREFEDTIIDTQRFVCSDSIVQFITDSNWCMRPDVYLYIDDENLLLWSSADHIDRLGDARYYFNVEELLNKENDTCIYRNVFPSNHFEVYMVSTRHLQRYRSNDEIFERPIVDSYRLGVMYRYTWCQQKFLNRKIMQWEQDYIRWEHLHPELF